MKNDLTKIIERYIGATPNDVGCNNWAEMQSKMEEEINKHNIQCKHNWVEGVLYKGKTFCTICKIYK